MKVGIFAVPVAMALCGLIILFEVTRNRDKLHIDLLLGVSIIYLICFGIVPIFIYISDLSLYPGSHWIRKIPEDSSGYLFASMVSFISYVLIIMGYFFHKQVRFRRKRPAFLADYKKNTMHIFSEKRLCLVGFGLFVVGVMSLIIYVNSIGGVKTALETATLYRSGRGPIFSRWLFLKNIAPLVMVSSYFFFAFRFSENRGRKLYTLMFIISFGISLYLTMLLAGRLTLVRYVGTFPLFIVLYKNKGRTKFIISSIALALLVIIFGNSLFRAFSVPAQFWQYSRYIRLDLQNVAKLVLIEFSFPYVNLANLLDAGREISFRYFSDLFIGTATLLPESLLGIETPASLSKVNTNYFGAFGTIPVDLVSFGYYSLSIPGVAIVTFVFGMIIKALDFLFPPQRTPIESIFRAAWIIFISFRVMYGDISLVMQGGFELFVGTLLLLWSRKRSQLHRQG